MALGVSETFACANCVPYLYYLYYNNIPRVIDCVRNIICNHRFYNIITTSSCVSDVADFFLIVAARRCVGLQIYNVILGISYYAYYNHN